jgi:hypothetical protein
VWTSIVLFVAALVYFVWSARRHPGREESVWREGFEPTGAGAATADSGGPSGASAEDAGDATTGDDAKTADDAAAGARERDDR